MSSHGVSVLGQGPLVVFLHSSLSSSRQWQGLSVKLSEHFTCINLDLLGYGQADKVNDGENFTFDTEVNRIICIVDDAYSGRSFHLVGHSCGGAIALKMAVEFPERILSLTLYEPVAFHLLEDDTPTKQQFFDFAEQIALLDQESAARTFVDYWNGQSFFDSLPSKLQQMMMLDMGKVNLDFKGIASETYTFEDIKNIQQPCLYLQGKRTTELSKLLCKKIIASLVNVSQYQLNCGHMGPVSNPELVEPFIVKFLNSYYCES